MLNDLLKQYAATKVFGVAGEKDSSQEGTLILKKIAECLAKKAWKVSSSSVDNNTAAMMAFFEMFVRKIGGDMPALLCYYYSTLVAKDNSLPVSKRVVGNKFRAFVTFKNMDKWDMILSMAQAPLGGYNGNLTESSFFDILLLSDVYKAWNSDPSSPMLTELQKQAPKVAAMHPTLSRTQVMAEGEIAHEAVWGIIETLVKEI